ncbi:zinc finger protein 862 isoform X1 [Tachysurus ichikawai]
MGVSGGVGALLREEIGEHILSFHCMPHRLELAMLDVQKSVPMIEKVYDLLQLVWKTYHCSPKSKRELKAIGMELGCAMRTPSAVKTQRWLPHVYRALSVFLAFDVTTGQGQYTAVHLHMQHLAASSKNTEIRGRAMHISQQMEKLPFVVLCHFLHDLFGEISKLSLILQKNSVILPQAIAAIDSCVCTIKRMKDKPVRNGKLEEFLNYTNFNSVSQHDNVVEQDKAQREKQTRWQKKAASSDYTGISFQNIPLKGCDLPGFSEELNHLIDKTIDITVKELERRFEMMRDNTQHKNTKRAEII